MRKNKRWIALMLAAGMTMSMVGGCGSASGDGGAKEKADAATLVLRNGVIQTMVSEDDVAEAVAVKDDEIIYVGDEKGIEAYIGDETEVIDLDGAQLTPGLMDGHQHAAMGWMTKLFEVPLSECKTNDEYIAAVEKFVTENPDVEIVTGGRFDLNNYAQPDGTNPGPVKEDLDAVCPDKPVILKSVDGHSFWVNSKALEMAEITKDTPDPNAGVIVRNEDGTPRGMLTDNAKNLVEFMVAKVTYTDRMYRDAAEAFQEEAHSMGFTGMTTFPSSGKDAMKAFRAMEEEGVLRLRLKEAKNATPDIAPEDMVATIKENNATYEGSEWMDANVVKFYADGVTEGKTGVFLEPYEEAAGKGPDYKGEPIWTDDELNAMVAELDKNDIQVHIHAIGDGAVNQSLNAFEYAAEQNGEKDSRFTMTHVCAITPEDIQRVADMKVVSAMQFLWMYADPLYQLEKAMVGEERAMAFYPTKDMIEAGCILSGASDAPVTPYNAFDEMEVAVTRNSPYPGEDTEDMYRWPEQAVTPYQALEAYTKNVAYENFWEDRLGTIEVGKKADFAVFGQNLLTCKPETISDTEVLYTVAGGEVVYRAK